jgi:flagellar motility protein MotE (MotC chaperone)
MAEGAPRQVKQAAPPFTLQDLKAHFQRTAVALRKAGVTGIADSLDALEREADFHYSDLEQLEQRLTALEDKLVAEVRTHASEESLFAARREVDSQLKPYRSKMTADQLAMLERQLLERRLLEDLKLPRLSLFYIR